MCKSREDQCVIYKSDTNNEQIEASVQTENKNEGNEMQTDIVVETELRVKPGEIICLGKASGDPN